MTICNRRVRIRKRTLEESSGTRSSAQVVASNDDLLLEILLRLPIKSLLRVKSVSKQWLSLITHPHFTRRKSLNSHAVSALYVECYSPDYRYYDLVPLDPSQTRVSFKHLSSVDHPCGIEFLQSCNGLLCCRSVVEDKFSIYNPTTKQLKTIPLPFGRNFMGGVRLNLAFEPSKSHIYKAVCFGRTRKGRWIMIYSSETRSWRVCGTACNAPIYVQFQSGVYWNGAIHWVSPTDASFWVGPKEASIYFDLEEELVREMPMPPLPHDSDERKIRYFGESGGHLHLVEIYDDSTSQFNVYEMEIDRSGWFVKFQVDLNGVSQSSYNVHPFQILTVVRGEKEDDSFIVLCIPGQIIRYSFSRKTHQTIYEFSGTSIWPNAFQYIESISRV